MKVGAMKGAVKALENVGLRMDQNPNTGKFSILSDTNHKAISRLKSLSEADKQYIHDALKRHPSPELAPYIYDKIERLYDFEQMGLRSLQRPELDKIDLLEQSKIQKRQVLLINYRSNSNVIKNRLVECHEIEMESGTIKVFDIDKMTTRHFKVNRIERVELTNHTWRHEEEYIDKKVDAFRIADNNKIRIHLLLDVYGYNSLKDTFPVAADIAQKGNIPNTFHLETKVNHQFLGVVPFILANPGHVQILNPPELIEKVKNQAEKILSNNISH